MQKAAKTTQRRGLTLLEILIVIAIIGLLLALSIAAVQRARDSAAQLDSKNNLKNIILAVHNYSDVTGRLPEAPIQTVTWNGITHPAKPVVSVLVSILPYIDQSAAASLAAKTGLFLPPAFAAFISPADPTASDGIAQGAGISSYAANNWVFRDGMRFAATFGDGASNTIAFAEHYAYNCQGATFTYWLNAQPASYPQERRATFADFSDVPPVDQLLPGWWYGGGTYTFQVAPSRSDCNPRLAQTPHSSGMLVALGDGSVRTIAPGISNFTYWAAVTPRGNEVLGNDW